MSTDDRRIRKHRECKIKGAMQAVGFTLANRMKHGHVDEQLAVRYLRLRRLYRKAKRHLHG